MRLVGFVAMPEFHHLRPSFRWQVFPCLNFALRQNYCAAVLAAQFYIGGERCRSPWDHRFAALPVLQDAVVLEADAETQVLTRDSRYADAGTCMCWYCDWESDTRSLTLMSKRQNIAIGGKCACGVVIAGRWQRCLYGECTDIDEMLSIDVKRHDCGEDVDVEGEREIASLKMATAESPNLGLVRARPLIG